MIPDTKEFHHSGPPLSIIHSVYIEASIYGTTMTMTYLEDKKTDVLNSLSKAKIPIESHIMNKISIQTPIHETTTIKTALIILTRNGLINKDFAEEIATNYPNGFGGTMDLNNLYKGANSDLMLAAASFFYFNEHTKKEFFNEPESKPSEQSFKPIV